MREEQERNRREEDRRRREESEKEKKRKEKRREKERSEGRRWYRKREIAAKQFQQVQPSLCKLCEYFYIYWFY